MVAMNYLSPVSSIESIKSENIASLFDDPQENNDLIKCLDAIDLRELKQYFFPNENVNSQKTRSHSQLFGHEGISLTKEEFSDAMLQIFGKENLKSSALKFFEDLQRKKNITDSISWHHVVDTIIEQTIKQKSDASSTKGNVVLQYKTRCSLPHIKDSIIQIDVLEKINSFAYVVASMCGKIGIYDEDMIFCEGYELPSSNFRRKNKWICSASYTSSGYSIFFSTFDRSLYVYNTSRLQHRLKFEISVDTLACDAELQAERLMEVLNFATRPQSVTYGQLLRHGYAHRRGIYCTVVEHTIENIVKEC